jgi:hypothetical protein
MPWPTTDEERQILDLEIRSVLENAFVRAAYLEPPATHVAEPAADAEFDVAGVGLELTASDGSVFSTVWQMEGYNEGLSFGPGDGESRHWRDELRRRDVTDLPQWQPFLGIQITDVHVGWHVPNEGCPEAVWAIRLEFEGGRNLLVALGHADGAGGIKYLPDQVVIVFDQQLVQSYQIPAQTRSVWAT